MRRSTFLLAAIVVLSGCSSGPDEGLPTTEPPTSSSGDDVPAMPSDEQPRTIRITFDYEGNIGTTNCVPSTPNTCLNAQPPSGQQNTRYNTSVIGHPLRVVATLWWNSTQSQTTNLEMVLVASREGETEYIQGEPVIGASPLTLDVKDVEWREGDWSPYISVKQPNQYSRPLYGHQHGPEEFHVVGFLIGNNTGVPGRILGIPS